MASAKARAQLLIRGELVVTHNPQQRVDLDLGQTAERERVTVASRRKSASTSDSGCVRDSSISRYVPSTKSREER